MSINASARRTTLKVYIVKYTLALNSFYLISVSRTSEPTDAFIKIRFKAKDYQVQHYTSPKRRITFETPDDDIIYEHFNDIVPVETLRTLLTKAEKHPDKWFNYNEI